MDSRLGLSIRRREVWLVGSNYIYAFVANFCPRKSSRRRHVAGALHDHRALERLGDASTLAEEPGSGGRQSAVGDLEIVLPCFLFVSRARLSREGSDRKIGRAS